MTDPVTPEEYGLRAAKRQLKKDNASLVEQNLALRSKVSVLAAQLEAVKEQRKIDREEFQLACDQIDQLEAQLEAAKGQLHATRFTLAKALSNSEGLERELGAAQEVIEAAREVRTGLGLTAYEGTPVSVWSAKNYEKQLGNALAAYDAIALPSSQQQGHTEAS